MLTKIAIHAAITLSIVAAIWPASILPLLMAVAVCTAAVVSALEAGRMGRYIWLWGFVAIAVLFNPLAPLPMSRVTLLLASMLCAAAFISWLLVVQRAKPDLSAAEVLYPADGK